MKLAYRYNLSLFEGRVGVVTDVLHFYTLLSLLDYVEKHKEKTYKITKINLMNGAAELICDNSVGETDES